MPVELGCTEGHFSRRLVAILAAEVVGYSRLMGLDEEGTLERFKAVLGEVVEPKVAAFDGRIFKRVGDGFLAEFPSAVEAAVCAVEIQAAVAGYNEAVAIPRRLEFRMGLNLGDVIVEAGDVHGDGVNVAARLEALAEPGGICLSGEIYGQVKGKVPFTFVHMGERSLKNIARTIVVYKISDGVAATTADPLPGPPLPGRPSIAVLPFQNMSADPEQEYFADGMVIDIITCLSHMPSLLVIASNSSFTYKGKAVDTKQVGRELGVRYVLEGSVRKAGKHIRITGQLIDASTGTHVWAEHFDGELDDVFELQDEITARVVGAIEPSIRAAEIKRARGKRPESLDAYDHVLRGLAFTYFATRDSLRDGLSHFYRAIEIDPAYGFAYGCAAICYVYRRLNGWFEDPFNDNAEGMRLARLAAEIGHDDPQALRSAGLALAVLGHEFQSGVNLIDRTLALTPNSADAWISSALLRLLMGEPETAIEHVAKAMRLSPRDPRTFDFHTAAAHAYFAMGRDAEALVSIDTAMSLQPAYVNAWRLKVAVLAELGREDEAAQALARLLAIEPDVKLITEVPRLVLRPQDARRLLQGLKKAGLPEREAAIGDREA